MHACRPERTSGSGGSSEELVILHALLSYLFTLFPLHKFSWSLCVCVCVCVCAFTFIPSLNLVFCGHFSSLHCVCLPLVSHGLSKFSVSCRPLPSSFVDHCDGSHVPCSCSIFHYYYYFFPFFLNNNNNNNFLHPFLLSFHAFLRAISE
uniref:Uncharacterized protein n=1 Tax=Trypanosoma vivax (strain Y486) TaxID=1055687 RepID=G0UCQ6_TRYVY|nr:hypothetical protein TVY486_1111000 [Trypanosoma vivax Y486]